MSIRTYTVPYTVSHRPEITACINKDIQRYAVHSKFCQVSDPGKRDANADRVVCGRLLVVKSKSRGRGGMADAADSDKT
jgi:hypothetical protein